MIHHQESGGSSGPRASSRFKTLLAHSAMIVGAGAISTIAGAFVGAAWLTAQRQEWQVFAFLFYPPAVRHLLSLVALAAALVAALLLGGAALRNRPLRGAKLTGYWSAIWLLWIVLIAMQLMPVTIPNVFS